MSLLSSPEMLRRENELVGCARGTRPEKEQDAGKVVEKQTEAESGAKDLHCRKAFSVSAAVNGRHRATAKRASGNVDTNFIDMLAASAEQRVFPSGGHSPEERDSAERLERAVRPQSVALAN